MNADVFEEESAPLVGIAVLNYRHPQETLNCIRRLLEKEPISSRIVWIENDAAATRRDVIALLDASGLRWTELFPESQRLPPDGGFGVIFNEENLGYAGGNNVALRLFSRLAVPYAWVLNNDTLLVSGSSRELLTAAQERPEVGAWCTDIFNYTEHYVGGIISRRDYSTRFAKSPDVLENDPLSYASGCSIFFSLKVAEEINFLPEEYFLYYEDPAFSFELRKLGYKISAAIAVKIEHIESLSTGRRSGLMEFYSCRNRWYFIEKYFPEELAHQKQLMWYCLQKWFFRGKFDRIKLEYSAYADYKKRRLGRTVRELSRSQKAQPEKPVHRSPVR